VSKDKFSQKKSPKTKSGRSFKENNPFKEGSIFITGKGVGYVSIEGKDEDLEISPNKTGTALHGDKVKVLIYPKIQNRRQQGEVTEVTERCRTKFVGEIIKEKNSVYFKADDKHIPVFFEIEGGNPNPRNKIYAELLPWTDSKQKPKVKVLEILGEKGDHETETKAILLSHEIDTSFPEKIEAEAKKIKQNFKIETTGRKDFRDRTTFTIDPVDAKDFDDALSIKKIDEDFFEVGIHIADVSHFVIPGSELDKEARERSFSVYLVDRTIPMLPEILSNDLCSLNPKEDKYAFSSVFEINLKGEIRKSWFGKTIIKSDKRFSYEDAQKVLDTGKGEFGEELKTLEKIAQSLRGKKQKAGAIDFDTEEIKIELDQNKKPIKIYKKERLETMRLIEDFMLLANREVATLVTDKKNGKGLETFVFRIHDLPNREKIESLSVFLGALGYEIEVRDKDITPSDIQNLLEKIKDKPEEATIKTAVLRSMSKAVYSTSNIGHFGLSFKYYTHFTSPIRRYPDLLVHRLLLNYLEEKGQKKDLKIRYENILREATQKEISAMEAERDSIRMKQVEYMKDKVGEVFEGIINGVTEWGVFVEEKETKTEGLIRLKDLGRDYFKLDQKTYAAQLLIALRDYTHHFAISYHRKLAGNL